MSDLVEFLKARLDEDERIARKAAEGPWTAENIVYGEGFANDDYEVHSLARIVVSHVSYEGGGACEADAEHIARHDPARVLREVEAKRRIMSRHKPGDSNAHYGYPRWCQGCGLEHIGRYTEPVTGDIDCCPELRDLATAYSGHPDYREEWRP